jgi:magnesium transporter
LDFPDLLAVIWKEIRIAVLCGLALCAVSFLKIFLVDMLIMKSDGVDFAVAAVVSITLVFTVLCAKVIGSILPLAAKKVGFDPAVMASPFITTIVDAVSLIIYFQIAMHILQL